MPRYFFDVHDGTDFIDDTGVELADISEARREAVRSSGQAIEELGDKFWQHSQGWRMEVREGEKTVFTLRFGAS